MFKFLQKIAEKLPFIKSAANSPKELLELLSSRYDILWSDDCAEGFLDPRQAYFYFETVSPLQSTVKRIAQTVAHLPLAVVSAKEPNDLQPDHQILQLLTGTSSGYINQTLLQDLAVSYLITEEAYLVLKGNINRPPLDISAIRPYEVLRDNSTNIDGYPNKITTTTQYDGTMRIYHRKKIDGIYRYIDQDDKNSDAALNELVPIIGIKSKSDPTRGLSRLMALQRPLNQLVSGDIYNAKLLKSGVKPWMILSPKEDLSPDDQRELQESLKEVQGVQQVGGIFILPNNMQNISSQTINNREMEYIELIKEVKQRIDNAFYMPVPINSPEHMSYNNYNTAQLAYYDTPVTNLVENLFPFIVTILSARLKIKEQLKITYNEHQVPALQNRSAERMASLAKTETMKLDELRDLIGLGHVEGGDKIYISANKIPLGADGLLEE